MNGTNRPDTAKLIKQDLKTAWPTVKFSVRTGRGAGVSAVDVYWTDGPTEKQVEAVVGKYEAGHFNGMIDMYEYDKDPYTVDGYDVTVRYVICQRTISADTCETFTRLVKEYRADLDDANDYKLHRAIHDEVKEWDGSTTPIPQTTAELPSSIEYREWHKAYEAKQMAKMMDVMTGAMEAAMVEPPTPQTAAELFTPVQRESWRVW